MAHLAFVCPPFLGHVNPMRALASELAARGRRATFLGVPDAAALIPEAHGVAFRPVARDAFPPGSLPAIVGRMAAIDGPIGLRGVLRDVERMTDALACALPDELRAIGADLLVCDGTEAAGGLAAAAAGIPFVSLHAALPLNREPAVPPPFTAWRYDPSPAGLKRNRGGYRVSDWLMRGHGDLVAAHAARLGLPPRRTIEDCLSPLAQVSQTVEGFDFPRRAAPAALHHVGPLRGPGRGGAVPSRPARPHAYATLGTLQGGRTRLMRTIAEAARRLDLPLVLAHGGRLDAAAVARLPGRPEAHAFVDQPAALDGAALAVVNGGLNTVLDALAAGVPLVVLPIAFEQGAIAARVERAGAGKAVRRRFLTAGRLARAMDVVRSGPGFAQAAGRLRDEIARAGGVRRAADVVERALATGRPVLPADLAPPPSLERAA